MKRLHSITHETVTMQVELVRDDDKAILVMNEYEKEVWLPKSQLVEFKDRKDGTCDITITEQLATEKELV